jgi:hypothetical protein
MKPRLGRVHRAAPISLGAIALGSVLVLLAWDIRPNSFPATAHNLLGALPLALIAVAYLVYQFVRRPGPAEILKGVLLAAAFIFWAANQFWPEAAEATLYNDLAIALFVLDVFFVIVSWPSGSPDESFAEIYSKQREEN